MDQVGAPHPNAVHKKHLWMFGAILAIVVGGAFVFTGVKIVSLNTEIARLTSDIASTTSVLYGTAGTLSKNISDLSTETKGISQDLSNTKENIATVKDQVGGVQQTLGSVSGTVSTLQKLSTIDAELLKKYSKVYFLNENYTPAHLSVLPQDIIYSNTRPESFLTEAAPALVRMMTAAKADGVSMYVFSAFRSFAKQQTLKSQYTFTYGAGTASTFSADQGYSEHQLGTTVDVIAPGLGGELTVAFEKTPAFAWLMANAHKFGFHLSYPRNNTYYVYEPWHWRYVGVKLATYLHEQNLNFYDMDQRTIDTYLANLFD